MWDYGDLEYIINNKDVEINDIPIGEYTLKEIVTIEKIDFEGKKCYKMNTIDSLYYIDSETYLPIYFKSNLNSNEEYKYNIKFDSVKDDDIILPNLDDFELVNVNV